MKLSSSARFMVAQGQEPLLECMQKFRDRGHYSPDTFLAAVSAAALQSFLKDWCLSKRDRGLFSRISEPWWATSPLETSCFRCAR